MKFRQGYVSNSSSSSFVIAKKKDSTSKFKITLEVDLDKYVHGTISNLDELNEYLVDEWGNKPITTTDEILKNSDIAEQYEEYKKLLNDGYVIMSGWFSDDNDNDPVGIYLCKSGFPKKMKKIKVIDFEPRG